MRRACHLLSVLLLCALSGAGCRSVACDEVLAFVVMGDNRGGDDSGEQPAAFHDLVREVAAIKPAMVWNTGDMIYGRTGNLDRVRMQWARYREALAPLRMPVYHVPGNHDLWDDASGRLYRELWGDTRFVVNCGSFRFIALDTESEPNRVGSAQRDWLRGHLASAGPRRVFIFLHQPLFPVASHRETSLDALPAERDALHRLLVSHRDRIAAVFAGHEHLYHHEVRDGIAYYTTGGGGADLHVPPERGGFHHFLLVRATGRDIQVEVRPTGVAHLTPEPARRVAPGELLESWEQGRIWTTWDYSVSAGRTVAQASEGDASLQWNVDFARCGWPVVIAAPAAPDQPPPVAWSLDLYAPTNAPPGLSVTATAEGSSSFEAPPVALKAGWNRVRTVTAGGWLPESERAGLRCVQWILTGDDPRWRGSVFVDRLAWETGGKPADAVLLDGFERPLVWCLWNEAMSAEYVAAGATEGRRALRFAYDLAECRDPMLIGRAGPPLDLSRVARIEVSVVAADPAPALALVARSGGEEYGAPAQPLRPGLNRLAFPLSGAWLDPDARRRVDVLALRVEGAGPADRGELTFDDLRAAGAVSP